MSDERNSLHPSPCFDQFAFFFLERNGKWNGIGMENDLKRFSSIEGRIKRNRKRIQVVSSIYSEIDVLENWRLYDRESVIFTREISPNLDRYLARAGPLSETSDPVMVIV